MTIWKFLLLVLKKSKFWFTASCVLVMLPPSISAYGQLYYAKIISIIGENPHNALSPAVINCLIILAGIYISQDILEGMRIYVDGRAKIRYQGTIYNTLFKHNHKHSANFFNTEQSGQILAKTENIVFGMFQIFGNLRMTILPYLSFFITAAVLLLNINISLGLILISLSILEPYIIGRQYKKLQPYAKKVAQAQSKVTGTLVDSIANARLVKNTAAIYHERKNLCQQLNTLVKTLKTQSKIGGKTNMNTTLISIFFIAVNLGVITYFYFTTILSLENVILAATMISRLIDKTFNLLSSFDAMQNNIGSVNDALELLYHPFDITDAPNAKKLKVKTNNITFKNVTFNYTKDRPLFANLNIEIKPNEKIGLVGLSGSGKSTFINLILRSYDLLKGKILISGQDISKVTQFSLHQNIALISQEPCLFNRSIMENIRFARPKATDEEVIKAAKLAYIHDTIMKMPKGYDSVVGERGVKLSGGERQRIAIAAAILKNAPILILDEATSALDSESELAIEKALKNIMKNKTVIAIAHRLSTLKNMDRILVLEKGKIIEDGSQKELLKNKSGTFRHFYKLQSEGYLNEKME